LFDIPLDPPLDWLLDLLEEIKYEQNVFGKERLHSLIVISVKY